VVVPFFQIVLAKEKINRRDGNYQNQNHHRGNKINLGSSGIWHMKSLTDLSVTGQRRKI